MALLGFVKNLCLCFCVLCVCYLLCVMPYAARGKASAAATSQPKLSLKDKIARWNDAREKRLAISTAPVHAEPASVDIISLRCVDS